jgi:hypothetical protein
MSIGFFEEREGKRPALDRRDDDGEDPRHRSDRSIAHLGKSFLSLICRIASHVVCAPDEVSDPP